VRDPCTAIIYLDKIYMYLITPYLTQRYEMQTLLKELKIGIAAILNKDNKPDLPYERNHLTKRLRYAYCDREDDKKTNETCSSYNHSNDHRLFFCNECANG